MQRSNDNDDSSDQTVPSGHSDQTVPFDSLYTCRNDHVDTSLGRGVPGRRSGYLRWLRIGFFAIWGPGLIVMLADTDVGSTITAAQSGAEWG
ncbi:MAG: hypothetical protein M1456_00715, partial [Actinobacteria bacterium]|nr:hypothetical protein [Actinomycetota bacterium]